MARAEEDTTQPVGYTTVEAIANSSTRFSAPLHRPSAFKGTVASVFGNVLTVQQQPNWSQNRWVYVKTTQPDTFYVRITSGPKAGMYYTVTENTTNTLTLDLNGDVLEGSLTANTSLELIPYWTISKLFPLSSIMGSSNITGSSPSTRVLMYNLTLAGIDKVPALVYYYYTGSASGGAGWRRVGTQISTLHDDVIVYPDTAVVITQNAALNSLKLKTLGTVNTGEKKYAVGTLQAGVSQDNLIAPEIVTSLTLASSQLIEQNIVTGSSSITGSGAERVLTYDDGVAQIDKTPSAIYFYYTGSSSGGPGWRQIGQAPSSIKNQNTLVKPGSAFVIRKSAQTNPSMSFWTLPSLLLD